MKKIALAALAATLLSAGAASAADLPARTYTKAPAPVVMPFSWTGFYVGGFIGGAWANSDAVQTDPCIVGAVCGAVGNYNGVPPTAYGLGSSFIGGGTVGYNWQSSNFVLGLEGEAGYMRLTGSRIMNPAGLNDTLAATAVGDWYGILAGRLGVAVDRTLLYVKGGAAWTRNTNGIVDVVGVTLNTTTQHDVWGWAAGAGIEYAFSPNWSVKGEYMYLGVGKNFRDVGVTSTNVAVYTNVSNPDIHTAKIGLNYRFGGPVVAKY